MEEYVRNPKTKRLIKIGGYTYNRLLREGYNMEKYNGLKVYEPIPIKELLEREYYSPKLKKHLEEMEPYEEEREGRGSRTRGWSGESPRKGIERHILKEQCGEECFLLPDEEKFPICPKCHRGRCSCSIDCRGLKAAKIRAKQYKYKDLYDKIDRLEQQYCSE